MGLGKELFEVMLSHEGLGPEKFGYDRPSNKLLGFLSKHYGLKNYTQQMNNFVVYSEYFKPKPKAQPQGYTASKEFSQQLQQP
jgi:alpha-tubulin N-acetyltransferase 1